MTVATRRGRLQAHAVATQHLLRAGSPGPEEFAERLRAVPFMERDVWLDLTLGLPEAPADHGLTPDGVPYLPAGVDEILAVAQETNLGPGRHFVDLGSGLGRVVMAMRLLTGARCTGVELQPALVDLARSTASALGLRDVEFQCADASDCNLTGDVFFLYTPFGGPTLARVLARLRTLAANRITVCTVGLELNDERWLVGRPSPLPSLSIYQSHKP